MVTHCAIDGFSRLVLYIKCSDNNRSRTVYDQFFEATRNYGLPSRIRCDQGLENILVAQHMLEHRGEARRSILVGSSVHNQRIERLWRDSHRLSFISYSITLKKTTFLSRLMISIYSLYTMFFCLESTDLYSSSDWHGMITAYELNEEKLQINCLQWVLSK